MSTTTTDTFIDYKQHAKTVDASTLIGMIVWYTVAENLQAPHKMVSDSLDKFGLGKHVPKAPADSDVFRRNCSSAQRKKVPTAQEGVFENFMLRDPGSDHDIITRRVVREQVDAKNRRLGYQEVAELNFHRNDSTVDYKMLAPDPIGEDICKAIVENYGIERGSLNGYAIRELVRRVLVHSNATNVRYPAGGVYFLPMNWAAVVDGLEQFAQDMPAGVFVHSLPLIDDRRQRDMLRKAFEAESADRAYAISAEIAELRRNNQRISEERYMGYVTVVQELKEKLETYTGLLEDNLAGAGSAIVILQKQLGGLMKQINYKK